MSICNNPLAPYWCAGNGSICYECELLGRDPAAYESRPVAAEHSEAENREQQEEIGCDTRDVLVHERIVDGMRLTHIRAQGHHVACAACGADKYVVDRPFGVFPGTPHEQASFLAYLFALAPVHPFGVRALYGPTHDYCTQAVATVFANPGATPVFRIWNGLKLRTDERTMAEALAFFRENNVQTGIVFEYGRGVATLDGHPEPHSRLLRYYDLQRHWTKRIVPHLANKKLNRVLVRDFNEFTLGNSGERFRPGQFPREFETCDWSWDHRGREPRFWMYVKRNACHWLVNFNLRLAQLVEPDREWRIVNSLRHSTVWDGDRTLFDFNSLALGIDADECFWLANGRHLPPGQELEVVLAEHYSKAA
jgi:hypothetical protein